MNASHWAMFAGAALLMVLTPGPKHDVPDIAQPVSGAHVQG